MQVLRRTAADCFSRWQPRRALRGVECGCSGPRGGSSGGLQPPSAAQAVESRTAAAAPAVAEPPAQTSTSDGAQSQPSRKPGGYPFTEIEAKWQRHWLENKTFRTPHITELNTSKPKFYALDMFPYPSGAGLHVGHPEGYTATDIVARLKRHQGYNVLHPIGFDAFGLPAEQFAIQTGTHPRDTTAKNCRRFREQLRSLGFSYDWDREISTTDPEYYKWTQWIFLQIFKQGLAYQAEVPVNWCPALGTVLANEEVIDGKSERGSHPVVRMPMRQWMLRITRFAQRLLDDLDNLDWDDSIKGMQRNWIGRSEGADVSFQIRGGAGATVAQDTLLAVYTTRPDTVRTLPLMLVQMFGVTYMVVAPEYQGLDDLVAETHRPAVTEYVAAAASKSDLERTDLSKQKTGVFTGSYAVNPANAEEIPIWVADYVLGGYGSGAIMAVPGHDTRDFEFAEAFDLGVRRVVQSPTEEQPKLPYTGPGRAMNSSNPAADLDLNQLGTDEAKAAAIRWLEQRGVGQRRVNFKLRDWLFARQRYWGEPFPIIFPAGSQEPVAVPEEQLPLLLPDTDNFRPSGTPESPLAVIEDWVNTVDPASGRPARRETSTMPQWAGSCWYYLRYIDPRNAGALVDKEAERYWMPVDLYVGGAEHAVLHLLYARFWHKVLYDLGVVSTAEPFQRLVSQGMILGEVEFTAHRDPDSGAWVPEDAPGAEPVRVALEDVEKAGEGYVLRADRSVRVASRAHKMSKSRGNVVNPDDVVAQYGADSLRLYEMFMGPLRDTKVWNTNGVEGVYRFLARAWRLFADGVTEAAPQRDQLRLLHLTIKRVTEETEAMRFNTGISAMMEFVNAATKWPDRPRAALEPFALLLSPYAPHLAEELWQDLGHGETLTYAPWPVADESLLVEDTVNLPVQINGKLRGTVEVFKTIGQEDALVAGTALDTVARQMEGKTVRKVIFVPGKILNIIVG